MSITDPISDMLTVIRNAQRVKKDKVDLPASKMKEDVLKIVKDCGYILNYRRIEDGLQGILRVYLRYLKSKKGVITGLKRISKPGRRIYVSCDKIPYVYGGTGMAVLSTSKGLLTNKEARSLGIGGEVLCYIW
ncbi:MAG: 30S ribosomal protein S8 [Candidatus Omnitrophota bacterium]|nr:MAG: 30S ribosomal protein S8 [Candidatus Omnitrophota bacterium]